jgi:uncharacterized protein
VPDDLKPRPGRDDELVDLLRASGWFLNLLDAASVTDAPDWWIGAGVIRDLVWDQRFGAGFDPMNVRDVDLAFFDATNLSTAYDREVETALSAKHPAVKWDAKNQAAVHVWYPERFGLAVDPLESALDGVATWPEYATCVAVTLSADRDIRVGAPYGLDDLLDGVWRRNPRRVTTEEYRRRLSRKDPARRWPGVQVLAAD